MRDYSFIRAIALLTAFASFLAPSITQAADGAALPRMSLPVAPDAYPANAMVANLEGDAVVRATIGTDGQMSDAQIEMSSGHTSLDAASITLANASRLSTPPTNAAGEPVSVDVLIDVSWKLPLEAAGEYLLELPVPLEDGMTLPMEAENQDVRARDYPPGAIRRRVPGAVALDILVSEAGEPETIELLHSSGQNDIDRAAQSVAQRFRWVPATQDGINVAKQITLVMYWVVTPARLSDHCSSVPVIADDRNTVLISGTYFEGPPFVGTAGPAPTVIPRWVRVNEDGDVDTALLRTKDGWRKLSDEFAIALNSVSEYEPHLNDGVPSTCWYFVPLVLPPES